MKKKLPFACPICGRKTDRDVNELVEGATLTCPYCGLRLSLHGCMWEDVKKAIDKAKQGS